MENGAKIALILITLNVVGQLTTVYQTGHQLVSPVIPESTIWEINKQFVFRAIISALVSVIGLLLYFFNKYILVVAVVILAIVGSRFVIV